MGTIDSQTLHCCALGCIYACDPGTFGLFCLKHWELLPRHIKGLLRHEDGKSSEGSRSARWLRLVEVARLSIAFEEASQRLREERGWLPKSEALVALA